MMVKCHKLVLVLLFFPLFVQAASFPKYAPKLLRFEGAGYGIHKPIWGDREFTKKEALEIYRVHYWNKYLGNFFKSQALAEVFIDHIINAGQGRTYQNVKALQAIIGVPETGKLRISDVLAANEYPNPDELVNAYVKYRVLYYRSRAEAHIYPGWETRARSFFIESSDSGSGLADYRLPQKIEGRFSHISLTS